MLIYKIFRASEWAKLDANGETLGAPIDVADGYVHFSTAVQVKETAAKWFAEEDDLVLLACESDTMIDELKWEPSRGGALFPHLYRPFKRSDVLWHAPLPRADDAHPDSHIFPENLA